MAQKFPPQIPWDDIKQVIADGKAGRYKTDPFGFAQDVLWCLGCVLAMAGGMPPIRAEINVYSHTADDYCVALSNFVREAEAVTAGQADQAICQMNPALLWKIVRILFMLLGTVGDRT